jgi:hypothetical protein
MCELLSSIIQHGLPEMTIRLICNRYSQKISIVDRVKIRNTSMSTIVRVIF